MELEKEFIDQAILRLNENTQRIEKCLHQFSEKEVWLKPNDKSNSMGNLMLHLCGNITQYIISSLGDTEDIRERDKEFLAEGGLSKTDLMEKLKNVIAEATNVLVNVKKEKLLNKYSVQGFELTGIGIVIHVVEHYSYHTGQIAFYTKMLKDRDLGFYAGINLNIKNE
jgi:uncharacterized damage-inducible protein DinB